MSPTQARITISGRRTSTGGVLAGLGRGFLGLEKVGGRVRERHFKPSRFFFLPRWLVGNSPHDAHLGFLRVTNRV